jgi:hypothetical protein
MFEAGSYLRRSSALKYQRGVFFYSDNARSKREQEQMKWLALFSGFPAFDSRMRVVLTEEATPANPKNGAGVVLESENRSARRSGCGTM